MKLSEYKEKIISKYGMKLWEKIENSHDYKVFIAPEEEQLTYIKRNPFDIKYINNPTEEMQHEAINYDNIIILCINNPTDKTIEHLIENMDIKRLDIYADFIRFIERD